jgi:hypothetical protein
MRYPLRHPPAGRDAPLRTCAYLEALAEAARGLPLGPAAELVCARRSRGRHGNALQWHLGLEAHDGQPTLDWEDRIELKLVSVWRGRAGRLACDKIKVCDLALNPWHKLSNVLWVFVDRVTRVVVGHRFWSLSGDAREALERSWTLDPHFDHPRLFVELREQEGRQAPAYYVAARWMREVGILPEPSIKGVFPFDARWWSEARRIHGRGEPPLITLWRAEDELTIACARCDGRIHFEARRVRSEGWAPALHAMPLGPACALRAHLVIDADRLPLPARHPGRAELEAGVESRVPSALVWRLANRVPEPDDHLHEG